MESSTRAGDMSTNGIESNGPSTGEAPRLPSTRTPGAFALFAAGAVVALAVAGLTLNLPGGTGFRPLSGPFWGWLMAGIATGSFLRGLRRKIFFGPYLSTHRAFSYDVMFQGAVFLNPQLPYPSVEQEFLCTRTEISTHDIQAWFRVRPTSAVAIPGILCAMVFLLLGRIVPGSFLALVSAGFVVYRSCSFRSTLISRRRFTLAVFWGILGSVAEGWCFVQAGRCVAPFMADWLLMLVYLLTLSAFELTFVPFALGVMDLVGLAAGLASYAAWAIMPLVWSYRLLRGLLITGLMLFYLPRYKLGLRDLFDPLLSIALAHSRNQHVEEDTHEEGKERPLLSIVIPAYNEESRLPNFLPGAVALAEGMESGGEVLVVDDCSTDGTVSFVANLTKNSSSLRLIRLDTHRGKGAAVCRGLEEASGQYILFADADGATPIEEAWALLEVARTGVEVVIGSRRTEGSHVTQSTLRGMLGVIFCRLTNLLAVPSVRDTQCGFKLFRRNAVTRILPLVYEEGWAFDVEVLFLAQKFGFAIEEMPVRWTAVAGSKIHPVRDALRMFSALIRIRRRHAGVGWD